MKLPKTAHLLAAGILAIHLPALAQTLETLFDPYSFTSPVSGVMPYRLMEPEGFDPGESYPLLVVLHGLGGKGTDNLAQLGLGAPQLDPFVRSNFKSYTVLPQGSDGDFQSFGLWGNPESKTMAATPTGSGRMALELVDYLVATYPNIDPSRIYLVGQSMGGSGVFELLARRPDLFACGVPVYLGGTPDTCSIIATNDMPVRFMNDDQNIPWSRERLLLLGADVAHIARLLGHEGHVGYTGNFNYDSYALFHWMFSQIKDGPRVRVRHSGGTTVVAEFGNNDTYEVWLKTPPASDVVIKPLQDSEVSVTPTTLTFTPASYSTKQVVTVSAVNDAVTEGTHSSVIDHACASTDPDYDNLFIQDLAVTVQEGEASVRFTQADWSVNETDGSITLTVELNGVVTGAVSVDYTTTANGGATADSDYTTTTDTLNWPDGDRDPKHITIPVLDDDHSEGEEAFEVTLSNSFGLQLGNPSTATVHISDDEFEGVFRIITNYDTTPENGDTITFTVAREEGSLGAASVHVATLNGTAFAGNDFTAVNETLTWADGDQAGKSVTIFLIDDVTPEPTETLTLALDSPTGAGLGSPANVMVTIEDDDGFTISVVDSFDDGGRDDGADEKDVAWVYSKITTGNTMLGIRSTSEANPGLVNAASFNSNNLGGASFVAALPSDVTLANTGDYLEVTFQFVRGDESGGNYSSGTRVGFFNQETLPAADGFGVGFDAALGYLAGFAGGSGDRQRISRDDTTSSNRMHDNQGSSTGELLNISNASLSLSSVNLVYDMRFRVERADSGIRITAGIAHGGGEEQTISVVDTTSAAFDSFNAIAFAQTTARQWNYWDNIEITSGGPIVYSPDHDSDGDGQSDLDEFTAGTDPNDPASFFEALLVDADDSPELVFETIAGREYAVEKSTSLGPAAVWDMVYPWAASSGGSLNIPVATPDPRCFYRVKVRIP